MRRDNDGMDVITRAEFDDAMKNLVTKEDLQAALADTKSDILAGIDQSLTKALLNEREYTACCISEAKREILAVNKKNIADAIAPLNSRLDQMDGRLDQMDGRLDQMDGRLDQMDGRLDQMDGRLDQMAGRFDQMDGRLDQMAGRFDRMDEELRKLGEGQGDIAKNVATIAKFAQAVLDEHENRLKDAKL